MKICPSSVKSASNIQIALLGQWLVLMVSAAVLKLGGSDVQDSFPCTIRDQMYEAEQLLAGITESHASSCTGFIVGSERERLKVTIHWYWFQIFDHTVYMGIVWLST